MEVRLYLYIIYSTQQTDPDRSFFSKDFFRFSKGSARARQRLKEQGTKGSLGEEGRNSCLSIPSRSVSYSGQSGLAFADVKTKFSRTDKCSNGGSTSLIRVKAARDDLINQITAYSLVKQSIGPLRSQEKFSGPFILPSKQTAVFSQVYSTAGKQVSPPSSPSAALANFVYQPTLCLMQNFSPITYPSKGIRWLICECELVTINLGTNFPRKFQKKKFLTGTFCIRRGAVVQESARQASNRGSTPSETLP